jgi:hypothetical protein
MGAHERLNLGGSDYLELLSLNRRIELKGDPRTRKETKPAF